MRLSILAFIAFAIQYTSIQPINAQLVQCVHEYYGARSTGEEVYRIFLELQDTDDRVSAVFAAGNDSLCLGSDIGGIVNDSFGSVTGDVLGISLCGFVADICLDSYVTIGHAGSPAPGVTVYWDDITEIPCGQPVNAVASLPNPNVFSEALGPVNGENIEITDGSWFSTFLPGCGDQAFPFGMNNRVLIAQIAVPIGGMLKFNLNCSIFDGPNPGTPISYVWNEETVDAGEIFEPTLALNPGSLEIDGCCDEDACNYNPNAICDTSLCDYFSCLCADCSINGEGIRIEMIDGSGNGWEGGQYILFDEFGNVVWSGALDEGAIGNDYLCLCAPGCYTLVGGDGEAEEEISWNVYNADDELLGSGDWSTATEFCVEIELPGCIDSAACNFNPIANVDDGTCTYPGCTAPIATNYDPDAGCDDGSCEPPGDFNGDGVVDLEDVLFILGEFGCSGPDCEGDLDGDGMVGMSDILILLMAFGCC